MNEYYEIKVSGQHYDYVYDTQEIIKVVCDLVNGSGINEDSIEVVTHKRK